MLLWMQGNFHLQLLCWQCAIIAFYINQKDNLIGYAKEALNMGTYKQV